jgi:hypothetical protein
VQCSSSPLGSKLICSPKQETTKSKPQAKDKTASKQATLFSLKGAPSKATTALEVDLPQEIDLLEEAPIVTLDTETNESPAPDPVAPEPDLEETQLEETQVEETPQVTTDEPPAMEDDDEPIEWEESDREEEVPAT